MACAQLGGSGPTLHPTLSRLHEPRIPPEGRQSCFGDSPLGEQVPAGLPKSVRSQGATARTLQQSRS